jgi:hypothetical protein
VFLAFDPPFMEVRLGSVRNVLPPPRRNAIERQGRRPPQMVPDSEQQLPVVRHSSIHNNDIPSGHRDENFPHNVSNIDPIAALPAAMGASGL